MLELQHLSVRRQKAEILHDVSFRLQPNRITVLLGKNGSGKSTLIHCINRMQAYRGQILLNGRDLQSLSKNEQARQIGIFPQILPQTDLTVTELCRLGRTPYTGYLGRLSPRDLQAVDKALQAGGMDAFRNRSCKTLSGGERQMAFLSMLLAQQTPLLIMDEPVTYLDRDAAKRFYEIIKDLVRTQSKTALLVLHDINDALAIADDVILLDRGSLLFCGSARDCLETGIIESHFSLRRLQATDQNGNVLDCFL